MFGANAFDETAADCFLHAIEGVVHLVDYRSLSRFDLHNFDEDVTADQMSMKEYMNPFKGSKNIKA